MFRISLRTATSIDNYLLILVFQSFKVKCLYVAHNNNYFSGISYVGKLWLTLIFFIAVAVTNAISSI